MNSFAGNSYENRFLFKEIMKTEIRSVGREGNSIYLYKKPNISTSPPLPKIYLFKTKAWFPYDRNSRRRVAEAGSGTHRRQFC